MGTVIGLPRVQDRGHLQYHRVQDVYLDTNGLVSDQRLDSDLVLFLNTRGLVRLW